MSKNRRQGRDDAAAHKSAASFDDVITLIKERRKYVDWIAALEAKRAQTPETVYSRVHGDYEKRLQEVNDKLAAHQGSLAREEETLRKRLADVEEELERAQEERAETELRAHVGELSAAALTEALRVADTQLERLGGRKTAIEADLARVMEFVAAAEGTGTIPRTSKPTAVQSGGSGFDELSFLQSVVAETPPLRPVEVPQPPTEIPQPSPAPAPGPTPGTPTPSTPTPSTPTPSTPTPSTPTPSTPTPSTPTPEPAPRTTPPAVPVPESPPARTSTPSTSAPTAAAAAATPNATSSSDATSSDATSSDAKSPAATPAPSSQADGVVEKQTELESPKPEPPKAVPRQSIAIQMAQLTIEPGHETKAPPRDTLGIIKSGDELPPSILEDLQPKTSEGEKPFAANVASNNPLSLKSTGTTGELKTLKCRECGAMNDPAEWYCEKCGAELSAM